MMSGQATNLVRSFNCFCGRFGDQEMLLAINFDGKSFLKRATKGKKYTKKYDARAKLLFGQSIPIAFLPFSLPSPSSLLKSLL